jgi:hypothetical protein
MKNRELEPLLICKEDFESIVQISKSCDWDQLTQYIREQQNLSLLDKIGPCLFDKLLKYCQGYAIKGESGTCSEQEEDVLRHLFIGGRYKACDGETKMHFGLKRSLVHWAYGAYMHKHSFVDTPFGVVQKLNQDSVPVDPKELKNIDIEQRSNAEYYFKLTKEYLCSVKNCEVIKDCNICDCITDCSCKHCKNEARTKQRRGVKLKNISKY